MNKAGELIPQTQGFVFILGKQVHGTLAAPDNQGRESDFPAFDPTRSVRRNHEPKR